MNLTLLDAKLTVLAAVVILIIVYKEERGFGCRKEVST